MRDVDEIEVLRWCRSGIPGSGIPCMRERNAAQLAYHAAARPKDARYGDGSRCVIVDNNFMSAPVLFHGATWTEVLSAIMAPAPKGRGF